MAVFSKEELEYSFLTCQLSGPLTLLHALHQHRPQLAERESLTVHVVGASVYEMMGLIKWECEFLIARF